MKTILCLVAVWFSSLAIADEPKPVDLENSLSVQWKEAIGWDKLSAVEKMALGQLFGSYKAAWMEELQKKPQAGALAAGDAARVAAFAQLASPGKHWIVRISGKPPTMQVHLEDGTVWNVAPFGSQNITMLKNGSPVYLSLSDSPSYPYRLLDDGLVPTTSYCYLMPPK